jgi:hypothetical protein
MGVKFDQINLMINMLDQRMSRSEDYQQFHQAFGLTIANANHIDSNLLYDSHLTNQVNQ